MRPIGRILSLILINMSAFSSLLSDIGNALGSIASPILNLIGVNKTNATNAQIAQDTNQANLELYNRQFADQYRLWQENNEYNTPSAQVSRFNEAGLNPALMMQQNGSSGNAQAASAPSANPMIGYNVMNPFEGFSDLAPNIQNIADAFKASQEGKREMLSNSFLSQIKIKELAQLDAQIDLALQNVKKGSMEESVLKSQKKMIELEYKMNSETFDTRKQSFDLSNELTAANIGKVRNESNLAAAQTGYQDSMRLLTDDQRKMIPKNFQVDYMRACAEVSLAASQRVLNARQAASIFMDSINKGIKNKSDALDLVIKRTMWPETYRQFLNYGILQSQEKQKNMWQIYQQQLDLTNPFKYVGGAAAGAGAAGMLKFIK